MKTIDKEELQKKLNNNEITLIDVLAEKEYNKSHIKGAVNIPMAKIGIEANRKYDKNEPIVVYCSDKDCTASLTAGKKLEEMGFTEVYHYKGGKKEWSEAGLPME